MTFVVPKQLFSSVITCVQVISTSFSRMRIVRFTTVNSLKDSQGQDIRSWEMAPIFNLKFDSNNPDLFLARREPHLILKEESLRSFALLVLKKTSACGGSCLLFHFVPRKGRRLPLFTINLLPHIQVLSQHLVYTLNWELIREQPLRSIFEDDLADNKTFCSHFRL